MGSPSYHANRPRILKQDFLRYIATDWEFLRESHGMSKARLAREIGVSRPTMQHLEEHIGTPQLQTLEKLFLFWERQGIVIPNFEISQVMK